MLCVTLIASLRTLTSGGDHVGGVAPEIAAASRRTARWEAAIGVERSGIWIIAPGLFAARCVAAVAPSMTISNRRRHTYTGMPIWMAMRTSSATFRAPIRSMTQARWFSTVLGLMLSLAPISLFDSPAAANSMT